MEIRRSTFDNAKAMDMQGRVPSRRGSVFVLVVLLLPCLLVVLALAVDMGSLYGVKAELQAAADAAALASASGLGIDQQTARDRAKEYALKNFANGQGVVLQDSDIELGTWDQATGFTPLDSPDACPTAVRVTPRLSADRNSGVGSIFGGIAGLGEASIAASAVAIFGPRDIVLALDYSSSMNDDSTFERDNWEGRIGEVESLLDGLYQALGSPVYGSLPTGKPAPLTGTVSQISAALGLDGVPYPHPRGSWEEFIRHVQGESINWRPGIALETGYRNVFCYRTLVEYMQTIRPMASETPDLWKTLGDVLPTLGQQPITSVKDAVTLFLEYMSQQRTDDRVGLASYTYTDGSGRLEVRLTDDYSQIETTSRQMQAGHYQHATNIAGGLSVALDELVTRGRTGAFKLAVLLSDGKANHPGGEIAASAAAREQAALAAQHRIPILTISLGYKADRQLMQEIADLSGGIHFAVDGGDVAAKRDDLLEVFAAIAAHRPLRLVR